MSISLSKICDKLDRVLGTNSASYPTTSKIDDINEAQDDVYALALKTRGWNVDDFNHVVHDPCVKVNLVSGTAAYSFVRDTQSNLVLDVLRVMVKDNSGVYHDIIPVDKQSDDINIVAGLIDGQSYTGVPVRYDKTGGYIFLDPVPSYNATDGLKVYVSREPLYFTNTGDTTTVFSGIDGLCHDYLYLKPAYEYARDKSLQNREELYRDLQDSLRKVKERYGHREKDVKRSLSIKAEDNR